MKLENVQKAIAEAQAFIDEAKALLEEKHIERDWVGGRFVETTRESEYTVSGAKNAAVKRKSMDLTRALSKMRQDK